MSEINVSSADSGQQTPTPSAPASPVATPQAAPVAAPQATPQTPATGAPPSPEPEPSWLRGRLQETRAAAIRQAQAQFDQERARIQSELENYKRQLHAVVGVTPPQNPEVEQVRQQFAQLYPGLAKMEERAAQLEELLERSGDLQSQNDHYWQSYGRQIVNTLFNKAAESVGGPLNDEGKRFLHSSFVGWVQSSPENQERYTNDPTIVDDFLRTFVSNYIDPVRRSAAAQIPGRANVPLPQDTPTGGIRTMTPQAKPADLDERAAQGWALYNQPKV